MTQNSTRPRAPEYLLAGLALLLGLGNATSIWNSKMFWQGAAGDPFAAYHANAGIRTIATVALVTNLVLVGVVILWRLRKVPDLSSRAALLVGCAIAAILPWLELWWGSNFYYGEVRDKQGLPFGVTNGGPLGTLLLLGYIASRVPLPIANRTRRVTARVGIVAGIWILQRVLLKLVEGSWNLSQS